MPKQEIPFEIIEHIGVLSTTEKTGWSKEVNRVSWNGAAPKYDIRDWPENHVKGGKGVTLTEEEFVNLKEIMGGSYGKEK